MTLAQDFLNELTHEGAVTRKYLEAVPFDKLAYKPNEKSETLGRLAIHVAEIIAWWKACLNQRELDFEGFEPQEITSTEALLAYFDTLMEEAKESLSNAQIADFEEDWSMRYGETVYFTLPKKQVLRIFCMHHLVHHRAQLGVYLRMLDIPLTATYGPSADDEDVLLIQKFNG